MVTRTSVPLPVEHERLALRFARFLTGWTKEEYDEEVLPAEVIASLYSALYIVGILILAGVAVGIYQVAKFFSVI